MLYDHAAHQTTLTLCIPVDVLLKSCGRVGSYVCICRPWPWNIHTGHAHKWALLPAEAQQQQLSSIRLAAVSAAGVTYEHASCNLVWYMLNGLFCIGL